MFLFPYRRLAWRILLLPMLCLQFLPASAQPLQVSVRDMETQELSTNDTVLITQYVGRFRTEKSLRPDSALTLLRLAYPIARRNGWNAWTARIWGMMASTYVRMGDNETCKQYLDSAFKASSQLRDGELICYLHSVAAGMYQYSSGYAQAASHYFKALEAVEEYHLDSSSVLPSLYNNLGGLMVMFGEKDLSRKYLSLAREHVLRSKPVDSASLNYVLVNLGQTYADSNADRSIAYFKDAYKLARRRRDVLFSHRILINIARLYLNDKQTDSAALYLALSRTVAVTDPDLAETEVYTGFLELARKNYAAAKTHLKTSLRLAEKDTYEHLDEAYQGLAEVYAAEHQYGKAYEYQQKYAKLYEEKMEDQKQIVIDFMSSFHAMEEEQRRARELAAQAAHTSSIRKRNTWIVVMAICSSLLGIILLLAYRNHRSKRTLLYERMQGLEQQQEIERLKAEAAGADKERARIASDIHDGVMVRLANVKMNLNLLPSLMPDIENNRRYMDIIRQFTIATKELRNTAHNLMPEILLEDGIAQAIFYFCKTMENVSGVRVKYQQVGTPLPRLLPTVEAMIYRMVQELVQNIIRHAEATTCLVQLQYMDQLCCITVEDNGKGLPDAAGFEGYGLKSVRNRIKVLHGTFDLESEPGKGTTAYLEFDVAPFLASDAAVAQPASGE